jgi:hypothetical protein
MVGGAYPAFLLLCLHKVAIALLYHKPIPDDGGLQCLRFTEEGLHDSSFLVQISALSAGDRLCIYDGVDDPCSLIEGRFWAYSEVVYLTPLLICKQIKVLLLFFGRLKSGGDLQFGSSAAMLG